MKLNKKKISALLGVGLISALTFVPTLNTQALLTAPSNFQFSYQQSNTDPTTNRSWAVRNNGGASFSTLPIYQFMSDGSTTGNQTTFNIHGLQIILHITNTYTDWSNITSSTYTPIDSHIGTTNGRFKIYIENSSNKDYSIFLDLNTSDEQPWTFYSNDQSYYDGFFGTEFLFQTEFSYNSFVKLPITSHSTFYIENVGNDYTILNAFYLQDLGVNDSYTQGYDTGYDVGYDDAINEADAYAIGYQDGLRNNPNILLNGFQAMVGILVNFVLMIVNLEIFGVSILGVFSIVVLFTGIVWVLKLIRG
jgi:hypothetical protein